MSPCARRWPNTKDAMDDIVVESFDRTRHHRADFQCGQPPLDDFLRTLVTQYEKRRLGKTFVAVLAGDPKVIGYYTLAAGAVAFAQTLPPPSMASMGLRPCSTTRSTCIFPSALSTTLLDTGRLRSRRLGERPCPLARLSVAPKLLDSPPLPAKLGLVPVCPRQTRHVCRTAQRAGVPRSPGRREATPKPS
jgi:hypothetical protein